MISYGPTQFAIFRVVFGLYLTIHFYQLLENCVEVFSNDGVINDSSLLPSYGKMPIFLLYNDSPQIVKYFVWTLVGASLLFTFGIFRRISSLWLYYGWISLLNRNPLISNPSIGYIGWILLACALIPNGEWLFSCNKRKKWQMPSEIYYGMWLILGVSYTASGLHKFQCQTWLDGTALWYVLTGPLVRPNNIIVELILSNMIFVKMMTWGSLFLETSCLFLGTFAKTRKWYWIMFMGFHIGILTTVNFADLTIGMIIPHLFTFDSTWFSFTKKWVEKYNRDNVELKVHPTKSVKKVHHSNQNDQNNTDSMFKIIMAIIIGGIAMIVCVINWKRFVEIIIESKWGFCVLISIMLFFMAMERYFPDQELKHVDGWWKWVIGINIFQLFAVVLAMFTWENWLQHTSYFTNVTQFHLRDYVNPFFGGVIAYLINQWLFYHWHKARHNVYWLWTLLHQFHHSPSRIEAITSFYKHPLEIIVDSQIMAILVYSVLGLTSESSLWLSIFSSIGECIYHMNIKTPKIMGYFIQRPESHRLHHSYNSRVNCPNFSDIPLFDFLGETFENPDEASCPTGFSTRFEIRRIDMLFFKDVINDAKQKFFSNRRIFIQTVRKFLWNVLVIWGAVNSVAYISHYDGVKAIGFASGSSPLPLVFSAYNGHETYSTGFNIIVNYQDNTTFSSDMNVDMYNRMKGAYNRRNIYGAIFSHGPFFDLPNMITIRQSILKYAVCDPAPLIHEFQISIKNISNVHVDVFARSKNNTKIGELYIEC